MTIFNIIVYLYTLPTRLSIRKDCKDLVSKITNEYTHINDKRERAKWVLESFKRHCYGDIWRKYPTDCLPLFEEECSRMINKLAKVIFSEK